MFFVHFTINIEITLSIGKLEKKKTQQKKKYWKRRMFNIKICLTHLIVNETIGTFIREFRNAKCVK